MRRRDFIAGLGVAGWPILVRAQQTKPTIGVLGGLPEYLEAIRRGLADVGFLEGRDVTIEYRPGGQERMPALAADLVRQRPAAIVAPFLISALAAKAATRDIPIIFAVPDDPVENGLVANLNRPGGNLTGVMLLGAGTEIAEKRVQLLHEAVPATGTIALLVGRAGFRLNQVETRHMQSAASTLGLRLLVFNLVAPFLPAGRLLAGAEPNLLAVDLGAREALGTELTQVFTTLVEHQAGAVLMGTSSEIFFRSNEILSHAARFALPTMGTHSDQARAGGLLSYGAPPGETARANRQVGAYTGRILKGERPGDLPVIQQTKFEFVVNLKTAKALGLTIPTNLLVRADEVIE